MIEISNTHIDKKALCIFFALSIAMGLKFFLGSNASFQRDSDRYVDSMIAAGILNMDMSETKFGMNLFSVNGTRYVGAGEGGEDGSSLYFVYNAYSYLDDDVQIASTRMQQIGIQSWVAYFFGLICRCLSISGRNCYHLMRAINAMLLAMVLVAISFEIKKSYNVVYAFSFYVISFASIWLTDFAPTLYWVTFSWYLPMLLGLICLNHTEKRFTVYPLILVAVAFKAACGYEYMPNVMLGAILFLTVEWIISARTNKHRSALLLRSIIGISAFCLLGFFLVLALNCYMRGNGSIAVGFDDLYHSDILRRTFGNADDFDPVYAGSLNASIFTVLVKYLFTPTGVIAATLLLTDSILLFKRYHYVPIERDVLLLFFSLITSISWFVLGKSHSYIHTISAALFYLPYMQTAGYIALKHLLGIAFERYSEQQIDSFAAKMIHQIKLIATDR